MIVKSLKTKCFFPQLKLDVQNLKDWRNFVDVKNWHYVGGDVDDDLVGAVDGRRGDVRLKATRLRKMRNLDESSPRKEQKGNELMVREMFTW